MSSNADQSSLYGIPRAKSTPTTTGTPKSIPSSSTLAFTTHLTSLISKDTDPSSSSRRSHGRPRPSKLPKSDIFTKHNKGAQKRAAADLLASPSEQNHATSADLGGAVDDATLHRSKRRMEEKARVYDELKKGMYLAESSDEEQDSAGFQTATATAKRHREDYLARLRRKEREGLVDFDRKWADAEAQRGSGSDDDESMPDEDDDNASITSYEDELGRTRRGTRAEAARAARLKQREQSAGLPGRGAESERWKPARPDNLIYGATVQAEAFNPDAAIASHMSYLASKRDRSPTPPDRTHYDADAEVRNRGTGFYAFSKDEETRQREMEQLMNARDETQRERESRRAMKLERERVKDERRRQIGELRAKRRADVFLAGLGSFGAPASSASGQGVGSSG